MVNFAQATRQLSDDRRYGDMRKQVNIGHLNLGILQSPLCRDTKEGAVAKQDRQSSHPNSISLEPPKAAMAIKRTVI
jgi:hypothetical protein